MTRLRLAFFGICMIPVVAMAADAPPPEFIESHSQFVAWAIGIGFVCFAALIHRQLVLQDKKAQAESENNKLQWKAINNINARLSHLEGEHVVQHGGGRRPYDPPVDLRQQL